jgi:hypothetical protein
MVQRAASLSFGGCTATVSGHFKKMDGMVKWLRGLGFLF